MSKPEGHWRQISRVENALAGREYFRHEARCIVDEQASLSERRLPLLVLLQLAVTSYLALV